MSLGHHLRGHGLRRAHSSTLPGHLRRGWLRLRSAQCVHHVRLCVCVCVCVLRVVGSRTTGALCRLSAWLSASCVRMYETSRIRCSLLNSPPRRFLLLSRQKQVGRWNPGMMRCCSANAWVVLIRPVLDTGLRAHPRMFAANPSSQPPPPPPLPPPVHWTRSKYILHDSFIVCSLCQVQ